MSDNKLYFCSCYAEGVVLEIDDWNGERTIELAFWRYGHDPYRNTWRHRLRHIWHVIRHGHPYTDMVVLPPEIAKELGEALCEAGKICPTP